MQKLKIAVINTDWAGNEYRIKNNTYGGVGYYRLVAPIMPLNETDEFEVTYFGANTQEMAEGKSIVDFWMEFVSKFDIFVIKAIDNDKASSPFLFMCKHLKKKVIIDLDDNLFEVKEDQPAWEFYKPGAEKRVMLAALLSLVDGLFVSTQPLADYYANYLKKAFNKKIPIFVLPNYHDRKEWNYEPAKKDPNKVVIGWIGSTTHFNDLKLVLPAMNRLMLEHKNLEFNLIGGLSHEEAPELFKDMDDRILDRIFCGGGTQAWDKYPAFLASQPWDIGIAPVTDDEFNKGKSHIKFLEYASYAIPCVASKVYPYYMPILGQNTIVDGETGMIADVDEWYTKLKKLIVDKEFRENMGKKAQEYVFNNLQYDNHRHLWVEALSQFAPKK